MTSSQRIITQHLVFFTHMSNVCVCVCVCVCVLGEITELLTWTEYGLRNISAKNFLKVEFFRKANVLISYSLEKKNPRNFETKKIFRYSSIREEQEGGNLVCGDVIFCHRGSVFQRTQSLQQATWKMDVMVILTALVLVMSMESPVGILGRFHRHAGSSIICRW